MRVVRVRRGPLAATGTALVVLVGVLTLLGSGGATGANAEHCARLTAESQARERQVTGHGAPVIVIGDSYSVGFRLGDPRESWPSSLPGLVRVYGFSGSGFSAHASPCPDAGYAARAPRALGSGPGQVVVEGGLNDYDQPASALRAGFRALVRELRGRQVLVVGPPPAPSRAAAAVRVDAVLRQECARAGVPYLSMIGRTFSYLDDGLHLTPAGHQEFGRVVADALAH